MAAGAGICHGYISYPLEHIVIRLLQTALSGIYIASANYTLGFCEHYCLTMAVKAINTLEKILLWFSSWITENMSTICSLNLTKHKLTDFTGNQEFS